MFLSVMIGCYYSRLTPCLHQYLQYLKCQDSVVHILYAVSQLLVNRVSSKFTYQESGSCPKPRSQNITNSPSPTLPKLPYISSSLDLDYKPDNLGRSFFNSVGPKLPHYRRQGSQKASPLKTSLLYNNQHPRGVHRSLTSVQWHTHL